MPFATQYLGDPGNVGAGHTYDEHGTDLAHTTFEDDLKVGRFAKLDSGSIDNLDNSATPVLAGVVLRNQSGKLESGGTIDADLYGHVDVRRVGLVTIDVKSGETPAAFTRVYANNDDATDGGLGMGGSGGNNVATTAEFIEEVQTDVWLVLLGSYAPA
tara:strand:- start:479 stop:952 length:474 start_codon:yes stop_codon:yes gene_type:complete